MVFPAFDLDYPSKKRWVQGVKKIHRRKSTKRNINDVPKPPPLTRSTQYTCDSPGDESVDEFTERLESWQRDVYDSDEENHKPRNDFGWSSGNES